MIPRNRSAIAALVLTASSLVGIAIHEGYVEVAAPPVRGDVPTNGFGHTGVKAGTKTTPVRALVVLLDDITHHAAIVKSCVKVPLHQYEYDAFVSLAVNIGHGKGGVKDGFCVNKEGKTAIIPRRLNAGDYKGACEAILMYGNFKGKPLAGLGTRRQAEYVTCLGVGA